VLGRRRNERKKERKNEGRNGGDDVGVVCGWFLWPAQHCHHPPACNSDAGYTAALLCPAPSWCGCIARDWSRGNVSTVEEEFRKKKEWRC